MRWAARGLRALCSCARRSRVARWTRTGPDGARYVILAAVLCACARELAESDCAPPPSRRRPQTPPRRGVVAERLLEERELCSGGELFDFVALNGGLLPADQLPMALGMFAQMASAVSYAHSRDLVAGQLRPEHILLHDQPTEDVRPPSLHSAAVGCTASGAASGAWPLIKLLGFEPRAWRELKCGTAYPPELLRLARERAVLDAPELHATPSEGAAPAAALAAADVWTLGVMLVALLAGSPPTVTEPCTGETVVRLPDAMRGAPARVLELIHSMLRLDPAERPSAELVKALVDGLTMPPPPPSRSKVSASGEV